MESGGIHKVWIVIFSIVFSRSLWTSMRGGQGKVSGQWGSVGGRFRM